MKVWNVCLQVLLRLLLVYSQVTPDVRIPLLPKSLRSQKGCIMKPRIYRRFMMSKKMNNVRSTIRLSWMESRYSKIFDFRKIQWSNNFVGFMMEIFRNSQVTNSKAIYLPFLNIQTFTIYHFYYLYFYQVSHATLFRLYIIFCFLVYLKLAWNQLDISQLLKSQRCKYISLLNVHFRQKLINNSVNKLN